MTADPRLCIFDSNGLIPGAVFLRRELDPSLKVKDPSTLEYWRLGNENLAQLFEAAQMGLSRTGYRDELLRVWGMATYTGLDCFDSQSGFPIPTATEGTIDQILHHTFKFRVGHIRTANYLLNTMDPSKPSGVLHVLNFAIVEWISRDLHLDHALILEYVTFDTFEEVFAALANGTIDATSNFIAADEVHDGQPLAATFRPACSVLTLPMQIYVLPGDQWGCNITNMYFLYKAASKNLAAKLAAVGLSNYQTLAATFPTHTVIKCDTNDEAYTLLRSNEVLAMLSDWERQPAEDVQVIDSHHTRSYTTYFRRDRLKACGDADIDTLMGEECLPGYDGCTSECVCIAGYQPTTPLSGACEIVTFADHGNKRKTTTVIVVVVCSVGGVLILGCIIAIFVAVVLVTFMRQPEQEEPFISVMVDDLLARREKFDGTNSILAANMEEFPLLVSATTLHFGHEKTAAPVNEEIVEEVTISNNNTAMKKHKTYTFKFFFSSLSPKYNVIMEPEVYTLEYGEEVDVKLKLTVVCTTKLKEALVLAVCPGPEWNEAEKHINIDLQLETKLSTRLDPEEFQLFAPPIGEGGFGVVYRGKYRGQEVAIKMLKNKENTDAEHLAEFKKEVTIMETLRNPYIVYFVGASHLSERLALVTEFLPLGSLRACMAAHQPFPFHLKIKCLLDISNGMAFLHENNILHRDLKPDNILMVSLSGKSAVNCKLTDFGSTREINAGGEADYYTKGVGTPLYMAPEILESEKYTTSADIYSYAILAWQVICEQHPYANLGLNTSYKIADYVCSGKRLPLPEDLHAGVADVVQRCWAHQPTDRPSFSDVAGQLQPIFQAIYKRKHRNPTMTTNLNQTTNRLTLSLSLGLSQSMSMGASTLSNASQPTNSTMLSASMSSSVGTH
eukprot:TRINITY_DN2496_c0_g1_i1.p1 TRINITY_DN2496_c0_g1~~TRINITY_DN2496_c0_g1_i1.p1  ORF type:complete len:1030 (-),score=229.84 TRINITY_DN2496_c0_g1_i1:43-2742(-)